FHLVGIGGAGMTALARILDGSGKDVTGSDSAASEVLATLAREGIRCWSSSAAANTTAPSPSPSPSPATTATATSTMAPATTTATTTATAAATTTATAERIHGENGYVIRSAAVPVTDPEVRACELR